MPLLWAGLYARWQFQDMIASRAVQVVQPDLIQAGGIWESRKIAAMAESKSIAVAPHCPFGPIALCASFHLDVRRCLSLPSFQPADLSGAVRQAVIPNFLVQEQTAMGDGMLVTPFRVDDGGYISIEQISKPGLGIEIDEVPPSPLSASPLRQGVGLSFRAGWCGAGCAGGAAVRRLRASGAGPRSPTREDVPDGRRLGRRVVRGLCEWRTRRPPNMSYACNLRLRFF